MDRSKNHTYFRIMTLVLAMLVFSFFSSGPAEIIMPGTFSEHLSGEENTARAAPIDDFAAGLNNRSMSARVLGMGGAFTAVADDSAALIYNPAGLADNGTGALMFSGGAGAEEISEFRRHLETGEDFLAGDDDFDSPEDFVEDLPESVSAAAEGLASIGLATSAVGGDLRAEISGHADADDVEADINYLSNSNVRLGLSSKIFRVPAEVGTATYGINLRYNRIDAGNYELYQDDDEKYVRESLERDGSGLAMDGGLLLQLTPMVQMGVMVDNILAQDIELSGSREVYKYSYDNDSNGSWEKDDERSDPNYTENYGPSRRGRIGLAARVPVIGTTFALDLENAPVLSDTDEDPVLYMGAENEMIFDTIRLRAGTYSRENRVFTAGAGINLAGASVDIGAGHSPGGNFTSLQVQLGLGF